MNVFTLIDIRLLSSFDLAADGDKAHATSRDIAA